MYINLYKYRDKVCYLIVFYRIYYVMNIDLIRFTLLFRMQHCFRFFQNVTKYIPIYPCMQTKTNYILIHFPFSLTCKLVKIFLSFIMVYHTVIGSFCLSPKANDQRLTSKLTHSYSFSIFISMYTGQILFFPPFALLNDLSISVSQRMISYKHQH